MPFSWWQTKSQRKPHAPRSLRRKPAPRSVLRLESLEDRCVLSHAGPVLTTPDAAIQAQIAAAYGQVPLHFEANQGQADSQAQFVARGSGYALSLTPNAAVLGLGASPATEDAVRLEFVGGNPDAAGVGLGPLPGASNYYVGNDPSQWLTGVPTFARVQYQEVYPGINVVYYGNQQQLEYDFVVAPGADPGAIGLAVQGAAGLALDAQGNLLVHTTGGDLVEHAP